MERLKADFHTHTCDDPLDVILHSSEMLIDAVAAKQVSVLAITCHERFVFNEYLSDYAGERGVVLVPGIEATLDGRHVLILNPDSQQAAATTFDELRRLGKRDAAVIAPHPYYPVGASLLSDLKRNIDLFDAIEHCCFYLPGSMYVPGLNPNWQARRVARKHRLPVVGTSDTHMLPYVDSTFTWIEADRNVPSIIHAIREGRVSVETRPRPLREIAKTVVFSVKMARRATHLRALEEEVAP